MIYTTLSEGDQSTKSDLRLVRAISEGKIRCCPLSASIFQSRASQNCPDSDLVEGFLGVICPSLKNNVVFGRLLVDKMYRMALK